MHETESLDSTALLLRDLGALPLLSQQETYALITAAQAGDQEARNRIIAHNLRLVVNIATYYHRRCAHLDLTDLVQEGAIRLNNAIAHFDLTTGNAFSTYATWWIRQGITRAVMQQEHTISVPIHVQSKRNKARRNNVDPPANLPDIPQVDSLDAPHYGSDNDMPVAIGDYLADPSGPVGPHLQIREWHAVFRAARINEREADIISMRFGLTNDIECTLEELGDRFGVSRERIRQIESNALRKLRAPHIAFCIAELIGRTIA